MTEYDYIRDGGQIYERSFAIIRAEADLSGLSELEARIAIRVIHACGMPDIVRDLHFSPDFAEAAFVALRAGKPILCDSEMVAHGITRAMLVSRNEVICTLRDPKTASLASWIGNTRSAAALDLWEERMDGALVVIGNAPTALFHLLELIDAGAQKPAAIIGMPVGFVGAAESKEALRTHDQAPWAIVAGRRGGSAMAAATVNALCGGAG